MAKETWGRPLIWTAISVSKDFRKPSLLEQGLKVPSYILEAVLPASPLNWGTCFRYVQILLRFDTHLLGSHLSQIETR